LMVSGFLTSPYYQLLILLGDARPICILSNLFTSIKSL